MECQELVKCYAHSREDGQFQLLKDHLDGVATRCAQYADVFGAGYLGYLSGTLHDIGKYSREFQRRIRGNTLRVDHSTAGAQWIVDPHTVHDADSIDTKDCCQAALFETHEVGKPSIVALYNRFNQFMSNKLTAVEDTPINRMRRQILEMCQRQATCLPGMFSLTVPTGGGKNPVVFGVRSKTRCQIRQAQNYLCHSVHQYY